MLLSKLYCRWKILLWVKAPVISSIKSHIDVKKLANENKTKKKNIAYLADNWRIYAHYNLGKYNILPVVNTFTRHMMIQNSIHWVIEGNFSNTRYYITVTSWWARWRLKSPAPPLFAQPFAQAQINENITAPCHWSLWGESTGDRWIPLTKDQ